MKLFCLSYAGGNATFYNGLEAKLNDICVVKLEYSGHGDRRREPFYNSFKDLANDLYKQIQSAVSKGESYALFGYSMGSIGVVELLKMIEQKREIIKPSHVFIAAHEPNTIKAPKELSDDEMTLLIKNRTIQLGGVPKVLIDNKSFWRTYLPVISADYRMIVKYSFEDLNYQTTLPTTVFYSQEDTPIVEMEKWHNIFRGEIDYYRFKGSHFFMKEHEEEIAKIVLNKLTKEM